MNNNPRFSIAFLTMLIVLSVITVILAILYGAELLLLLVVTIPMILSILLLKQVNGEE